MRMLKTFKLVGTKTPEKVSSLSVPPTGRNELTLGREDFSGLLPDSWGASVRPTPGR